MLSELCKRCQTGTDILARRVSRSEVSPFVVVLLQYVCTTPRNVIVIVYSYLQLQETVESTLVYVRIMNQCRLQMLSFVQESGGTLGMETPTNLLMSCLATPPPVSSPESLRVQDSPAVNASHHPR